ncbi:MAG TPA: hypothetical protein VH186_19850 [Chloroflexia bacterium]|nr:hypothetical protein [Chloroflexia bacterium]
MDYLFLLFVALLVIAGLGFLIFYIYRLDHTPEMTSAMRRVNRGLLGIGGLLVLAGLLTTFFSNAPLADWGLVIALGVLAVVMLVLAAQGIGIGFQQMEEDGIGFLRFFQLGSAIVVCMAFVPAFIAYITFATRLN